MRNSSSYRWLLSLCVNERPTIPSREKKSGGMTESTTQVSLMGIIRIYWLFHCDDELVDWLKENSISRFIRLKWIDSSWKPFHTVGPTTQKNEKIYWSFKFERIFLEQFPLVETGCLLNDGKQKSFKTWCDDLQHSRVKNSTSAC